MSEQRHSPKVLGDRIWFKSRSYSPSEARVLATDLLDEAHHLATELFDAAEQLDPGVFVDCRLAPQVVNIPSVSIPHESFAAFEKKQLISEVEVEEEDDSELDDLQELLRPLKLFARYPSVHHTQVMQAGRPIVDWWPSTGKTMSRGQKGPICKSARELVAWVRTLQGI